MSLRTAIIAAQNFVGALKGNLTSGRTARQLRLDMGVGLHALRLAVGRARDADTNPDSAPVYAKLADVVEKAYRDVVSGNMDVANMTENVNKMEEYITDIARRANVGGRRRKTRKTRKGKKRTTRRR